MVVPAAMPLTAPEPVPTVATAVLLLLQFPPGEASVRLTVVAGQSIVGPVMAAGNEYTFTLTVTAHPVGSV
jgi:hypothetical protein